MIKKFFTPPKQLVDSPILIYTPVSMSQAVSQEDQKIDPLYKSQNKGKLSSPYRKRIESTPSNQINKIDQVSFYLSSLKIALKAKAEEQISRNDLKDSIKLHNFQQEKQNLQEQLKKLGCQLLAVDVHKSKLKDQLNIQKFQCKLGENDQSKETTQTINGKLKHISTHQDMRNSQNQQKTDRDNLIHQFERSQSENIKLKKQQLLLEEKLKLYLNEKNILQIKVNQNDLKKQQNIEDLKKIQDNLQTTFLIERTELTKNYDDLKEQFKLLEYEKQITQINLNKVLNVERTTKENYQKIIFELEKDLEIKSQQLNEKKLTNKLQLHKDDQQIQVQNDLQILGQQSEISSLTQTVDLQSQDIQMLQKAIIEEQLISKNQQKQNQEQTYKQKIKEIEFQTIIDQKESKIQAQNTEIEYLKQKNQEYNSRMQQEDKEIIQNLTEQLKEQQTICEKHQAQLSKMNLSEEDKESLSKQIQEEKSISQKHIDNKTKLAKEKHDLVTEKVELKAKLAQALQIVEIMKNKIQDLEILLQSKTSKITELEKAINILHHNIDINNESEDIENGSIVKMKQMQYIHENSLLSSTQLEEELRKQISQLKEGNVYLQSENIQKNQDYEQSKQKTQLRHEFKIKSFQKEKEDMLIVKLKLEEQIQGLQTSIQNQKNKISEGAELVSQDLNQKSESDQINLTNLTQRINQLESELKDNLIVQKQQHNDLQNQSQIIDNLKSQIQIQESQSQKSDKEIEDLISEVSRLKEYISKLSAECDSKEIKNQQSEIKLNQKIQILDQFRQALIEKEEEIVLLQEKLTNFETNHTQYSGSEFQSQLQNKQDIIDEMEIKIAALKSTNYHSVRDVDSDFDTLSYSQNRMAHSAVIPINMTSSQLRTKADTNKLYKELNQRSIINAGVKSNRLDYAPQSQRSNLSKIS